MGLFVSILDAGNNVREIDGFWGTIINNRRGNYLCSRQHFTVHIFLDMIV